MKFLSNLIKLLRTRATTVDNAVLALKERLQSEFDIIRVVRVAHLGE